MAESQPATAGTKPPSSQSSSEQLGAVQNIISIAASLQAFPVSFSPASPWTPPPSPALFEGMLDPTSGGAASPSRATSSDLVTQASSEEAITHSGSASVPQGAATAHLTSAATAAGDEVVGRGAGLGPGVSAHATENIQVPCIAFFEMLQATGQGQNPAQNTIRLFVLELLMRLSYCRFPAASFRPLEFHSQCVARSLEGLLPAMAEDLVLNSIPHAWQCAGALQPEIQRPLIAWAIVAGHRSQRQCYLNGQLLDATVQVGDRWPLVGSDSEGKRLVFLCNSMLTYINALGVRVDIQAAHDSTFHESSPSGRVKPVYGCMPSRKTVESGTDGGKHFRKFKHVAFSLEEPTPSPDITLRVLFWHIAFVLQEVAAHVCIKRSPASEGGKRKLCPDVLGVDISLSMTPFLAYELVLRTELIDGASAANYLKRSWSSKEQTLITRLAVLGACLDTLQRVHEAGIVHCDVKPDNFIVQVDRETNLCSAVLIDLEGARANMNPLARKSEAIAAMQAGLAGMFAGEFCGDGGPTWRVNRVATATSPRPVCTASFASPFLFESHFLSREEILLGLHITPSLDMWSAGIMIISALLGEDVSASLLPTKIKETLKQVQRLATMPLRRDPAAPLLPGWNSVKPALGSNLHLVGGQVLGNLLKCLGGCFAAPPSQTPSAAMLADALLQVQNQLVNKEPVEQTGSAEAVIEEPAAAAGAGGGAAFVLLPSQSRTAHHAVTLGTQRGGAMYL